MKKIIAFLISIVILMQCQVNEPKIKQIVIKGKLNNYTGSVITIRNESYEIKTEISIDKEGNFNDTINNLKNGYYYFVVDKQNTHLYLKNDDILSIDIDIDNFDKSIKYSGIGSIENTFLSKKILDQASTNYYSFCKLKEDSFLLKLDSFISHKTQFLYNYNQTVSELNPDFINNEKKDIYYLNLFLKERYESLYSYFSKSDSFEVANNYYEYRNSILLEDEGMLTNNHYNYFVSKYINNHIQKDDSTKHEFAYLLKIDELIQSETIKEQFVYKYARELMYKIEDIDTYYKLASKFIINSEKRMELDKIYTSLKSINKGQKSPSGVFTNLENEEINLYQFQGKYVYLDIWAIWCGPCFKEAPYFERLRDKYSDKEIHFIKISIDNNKEEWEQFIKDQPQSNNSLYLDKGFDSEFAKAYFINSIPRFILLDKDLNIIDSNAPRPSEEILIEILDALL